MLMKSSLAAAVAVFALFAPAEGHAGSRLHFQFFGPQAYRPSPEYYYAGPQVVPRPRHYDYFEDEDEYEPDVAYGYEPDYYEPEYVTPAPRKQKPKARLVSRSVEPAPKAVKKKPVATAAAPKLMTCAKATGIVSGYGFADVKSTDCQGQSYAFNATRDGKPYVIKVNARSGELTDVAKQ
jgi:hypothetical protein